VSEALYKIGFTDLERWTGREHRQCEAPRHAGRSLPAAVVVALAELNEDGSLNEDRSAVWGACIECFGLIDLDMPGDWRLPGAYGSDGL
jgi:hypothetical protein